MQPEHSELSEEEFLPQAHLEHAYSVLNTPTRENTTLKPEGMPELYVFKKKKKKEARSVVVQCYAFW